MNFLTIDTTKATAYVVAKINNVEYIETIDPTKKHNENLLPTIDLLLTKADAKLSDIDMFGVVTGPGSFTGIRIGISTVKAFCFALNKKAYTITNFEAMSQIVDSGVVLIPCTHTSMYYCVIENHGAKEYGVILDTVAQERFKDSPVYLLSNDGIERFEKFTNVHSDVDFAHLLIKTSIDKITQNNIVDSNEITTFYLELSQAEREANAREKQNPTNI